MKIFNTLDDILDFTGCTVEIPKDHPLGKYAVFEVIDRCNCKYLDWATERGISLLDEVVKGKALIAYLPKHKESFTSFMDSVVRYNMEHYIASYKHLIGCEVHDTDYGNFTICSVSKNDNGGLFFNGNENEQFDSLTKFYLDDETHVNDNATLGAYEEYMQLHYPEYEHVWKHQL